MKPSPLLVTKKPVDCTPAEISDFIALVIEGGEVASGGLRGRVQLAERLVFLLGPDGLLGVAALKKPEHAYRTRITKSSGVAVPASDFPFELGWVVVAATAQGRGHSSRLSLAALVLASNNGVFATSHATNTRMHSTLAKLGFAPTGNMYPSRLRKHNIQLFLRVSSNNSFTADGFAATQLKR